MNHRTTRRSFFRQAALLTAAGTTSLVSRSVGAIEPIVRNGTAKFKFSLAAYSYRNLLTSGDLTLSDFIDDCAKMGLEGTELTSYYFPNPTTPEYLRKLKQESFHHGLSISGTAVGNDFCQPEGKQRRKEIESVKQWIINAEILGAPVIRIFSGNTKKGMTPKKAHSLAVSAIEECCQFAGQHGVHLALENHGGLTTNVDSMLSLVRDVKSPWFGVNMDTGNFHGQDIYGDLEKIAPYSLNVQVKVVVSGPEGRKPADFSRLAKILKSSGYRGYIVLEYEEKEDPRKQCPHYIDRLREAFA